VKKLWLLSFAAMKATATAEQKEALVVLSHANRDFSGQLMPRLVEKATNDNCDNLVVSSFGLNTVLSMLYLGARGSTRDQIKKGLALPISSSNNNSDEKMITELGFREIFVNNNNNNNNEYTLEMVNRIYVQEESIVQQEYKKRLQENFGATAVNIDFGKQEARDTINEWISTKTRKKINDLIPPGELGPLTKSVLVNAIYFKGEWENKFDKELTIPMKFYCSSKVTVDVPMMFRKGKYKMVQDKRLGGASVLEIPYKGQRLSMILFLSRNNNDSDSDEALLFQEMESKAFSSSYEIPDFSEKSLRTMKVWLPKFRLETSHNLKDPLNAMGMTDMFRAERADFSGINGYKDLYVSSVLQKAFIEVNEEGSEAAAATAAIMMTRGFAIDPEFLCNRPFLFAIKDNLTGVTLFTGRVTNPTLK